jgi:hypothetical protein
MINVYKSLLIIPFALLTVPIFAQQMQLSPEVKQALSEVSADKIKADITYLADDKLKGRAPGSEGYQMAVDYVIDQLKAVNVKPAGENNTWLQKVRLRKAFIKNASLSITGQTSIATTPRSFIIYPNP